MRRENTYKKEFFFEIKRIIVNFQKTRKKGMQMFNICVKLALINNKNNNDKFNNAISVGIKNI